MSPQTAQNPRSSDGASATPSNATALNTSMPDAGLNQSLSPQAAPSVVGNSSEQVVKAAETGPADPKSEAPAVTRDRFNAEMTFERRGYRPVTFHSTVEQALAAKVDPSKMAVFVDVKKGGFTAEEIAAIPDNAKRSNYHLGFARQLFDAKEGIFTKSFWTSSEGIKKVMAAGFIKAEPVEIHLEAAQWLLSKRAEATAAVSSSPNAPVTPSGEGSLTTSPLQNKPKIFEIADLRPLETRLQERFAELKASIAPRTLTVVVEDSASIDTVIQNLQFYKDFNKAFAEQVSKTQSVLDQVGKLGLEQPSQGIVFKKKQDEALRLLDSLSFSKSDLTMLADKIELAHGNNLPGSMRDAVKNADPYLNAIKKELEEARNIIRTARRVNPAPRENQPNAEGKAQVLTGSVAAMPRLGKELTVDPKLLESIGHAMVDANYPKQDKNAQYKAILSEFVESYVSTFSRIRKEIYEARMDGSDLNSMQKLRLTHLAESLGQQVNVSDLMEIGSSEPADTRKGGAHFGRVVDGSPFQKKLNQMKQEFSKALMKEIEKTPGTENTDTTFVAYKRHRYEKSGITEFLKS